MTIPSHFGVRLMARIKSAENAKDPATGRPLPDGVSCRGPRQYRARKLVNGQRIIRTFDTARLARAWLEETSVKVREGRHIDVRALDGLMLRALIERYRDECMAHRDADRTGHIPALLRDTIADLKLSRLTVPAVRGFRDRQGKDLAAATVVKRLNLLASILNHAMSEWDVPLSLNPASGRMIKRPTGADRKRNRRLQEDAPEGPTPPTAPNTTESSEYDRLLAAVTSESHPDDVWFVRWAIEQATRLGEAASLRWRDVNLMARTISLRHTKTLHLAEEKGPELRPLMPGARALLYDKLNTLSASPDPDDLIFQIGDERAFSVRYGRRVKKAGLDDLTFHDLRHEATSRLARFFPNPLDLCRVTGHRDLKSLDRYYQPVLTTLAEDAEERARLLGYIYDREESAIK
ncbi:site-specific integrase [Gluconobacter sp. Dm-62]|uniref:site-specific integrase n=1 Tax=Gluconobacter sp. Dm-62 TaxID=2799804 RepID=UPI001B8D3956|nr:site-specific integrase [Gluconobacter sp. Dm-62]MBS1102123.1 site-specific integrase [Gluconobacter sp. Dm-62]